MSAYYINELLQRLMTFHDPHPELFSIYKQTLESFICEDEELVLRRIEKHLLIEIGYGLNLESEYENGVALVKDEKYYYDIEKGPVNINNNTSDGELIVSGQTLHDLAIEQFSSSESKKEVTAIPKEIKYESSSKIAASELHYNRKKIGVTHEAS